MQERKKKGVGMLVNMKRSKLTHMTLTAGLLLSGAGSAAEVVTVTVEPIMEVTVDPIEEIVVEPAVISEAPVAPATSTVPATLTPPPILSSEVAAPQSAPEATLPPKPITPAQIVALRLQNTMQPRLTAAELLARRNGLNPQKEMPVINTADQNSQAPEQNQSQTKDPVSDPAQTTAAPSPAAPAAEGSKDQADQQKDPQDKGATQTQAGEPQTQKTSTTAPDDAKEEQLHTQANSANNPVTQTVALSSDRKTVAPSQARGGDLSQTGVINSQAFMTVSPTNGVMKGSIGYTLNNTSGVAAISDASRIRLTLNGQDITGRLSRVNTSRQDGYLAPGTMETGVIDLDQLDEGELILEWRVNTASTGGEQILRYRWTLVERLLNLPGTRQ